MRAEVLSGYGVEITVFDIAGTKTEPPVVIAVQEFHLNARIVRGDQTYLDRSPWPGARPRAPALPRL
ncbi:hypothetical protein [Actinomadura rubrisoli]|uniref:Uncharacterized protein n=1 Tax=Actinomadura rubrisoli TaxID=2530368 RepID=A0A4R5AUS2_9ACTN|nr:hypothetical protein [Actinomadura rubrisoli]TDD76493.1 hypothetical protein E1298_30850 [Actinomadura rubrisoli]